MRAALAAFALVLACPCCGGSDAAGLELSSLPQAQELRALADQDGFELSAAAAAGTLETIHGQVAWSAATSAEVRAYAALFAREFALYPPAFVRRTQLRRVVWCSALSFAGQKRMAVPEFGTQTLYLDIDYDCDEEYLPRVLHHEYFHIIDWMDDAQLYRDPEWDSLNAPGWDYGNGGRNAQDRPEGSLLTSAYPGFLTSYATSGVEEDKAETFSMLMVEPRAVRSRESEDPVLAAKVARLEQLLTLFSPEAGPELWSRMRALDRHGR